MEQPPKFVEPVFFAVCDIVDEIIHTFNKSKSIDAQQLSFLLSNSHVKALLETHDAVAVGHKAPPPLRQLIPSTMPSDVSRSEAVRVVGLRRQPNEPLVKIKQSKLFNKKKKLSF